MPNSDEFTIIGKIGLLNLSVLGCIVVWRTIRFLQDEMHEMKRYSIKRKFVFHIFLLFAVLVDFPMYAEFLQHKDYTLVTYSFHKFESACLFAAFSITVNDWTSVLYDIHEYNLYPFLVRKATLIAINVLYFLISLLNFIFCFTFSQFNSYTSSSVYITGIFLQVSMSVVLTLFMLSAGLRLSFRIQGVVGDSHMNNLPSITSNTIKVNQQQQHNPLQQQSYNRKSSSRMKQNTIPQSNTTKTITDSTGLGYGLVSEYDDQYKLCSGGLGSDEFNNAAANSPTTEQMQALSVRESLLDRRISYEGQEEFRQAIWNLNMVMATCAFCFLTQSVLLVANYLLGYESSTSKTVGPTYFYWTFYFWLPLWGVTLSLLYLAKTHTKRNKKNSRSKTNDQERNENTFHSSTYDSSSASEQLLQAASLSSSSNLPTESIYCTNPYVTAGDTPSSHSQSTRNTIYSIANQSRTSYSNAIVNGGVMLDQTQPGSATKSIGSISEYSQQSTINCMDGPELLSIHTEEDLFGVVFSPENSLNYYYRESNSYNMTTTSATQQYTSGGSDYNTNTPDHSGSSHINSLVSGYRYGKNNVNINSYNNNNNV